MGGADAGPLPESQFSGRLVPSDNWLYDSAFTRQRWGLLVDDSLSPLHMMCNLPLPFGLGVGVMVTELKYVVH